MHDGHRSISDLFGGDAGDAAILLVTEKDTLARATGDPEAMGACGDIHVENGSQLILVQLIRRRHGRNNGREDTPEA
ncbi:uncharacterized protein METZ01_LOCUS254643 [marine metagenome]|uniref:Uncharacterized protein n=1 Tax=marine metagenome TaxID=408172 RepID=A0A382IR91_9ZZZZ